MLNEKIAIMYHGNYISEEFDIPENFDQCSV